MDSTDNLQIGQVVKSKAGRDKGKLFLILDIVDDKNVLIVDGDIRKIDNPKLKKTKHLMIYNSVVASFQEKLDNKIKINDSYIRKSLEGFR